MNTRLFRRAASAAFVSVVAFGATPAVAQPAEQPDLKVTATFDSRPYVEGEPIFVDVTITNIGDADAKGAKGFYRSAGGAQFNFGSPYDWKDFSIDGPGATLAPGESRELRLRGHFYHATGPSAQAEFYAETRNDADRSNDKHALTIPVIPPTTKGTVGGVVYMDKNNNAAPDPGEGAADVPVTVAGFRGSQKVTTDANGRFEARDLSAGVVDVRTPAQLVDGWVTKRTTVVVDGSGKSENVAIRAVRPLSDVLKVSAVFNDGPYQPGDEAHLTVTLTNTGPEDLHSIVASCDRAGMAAHLKETERAERWGELASTGPGTAILGGQTRTFEVSGVIWNSSLDQGVVYLSCDVGFKSEEYSAGYPRVFTLAKVPGKIGSASGHFYHDRNGNTGMDDGEGIADLEFTLTDPLDGTEVVTVKTDLSGAYRADGIPAGWYTPVFHGPWKQPLDGGHGYFIVSSSFYSHGLVTGLVPVP